MGIDDSWPRPLPPRHNRPRLSDGVRARPGLLSLLEGARSRPIILISAPAGFGKTSLASTWLDTSGLSAVWLSIGGADNDLTVFLGDIVFGIRAFIPEAFPRTSPLLQSPLPAWHEVVIEAFLADAGDLEHEVFLVLDDYHLITSPIVNDLMVYLVEHLPANLHLLLATRENPPWPLARWRARGLMFEIRAADLRLTIEEAQGLLETTLGTRVDEATARALHEATGGWAGGLHLAALSLRGRDDPAAFVESFKQHGDASVRDYLVNEVLSRQPAQMQDFLLWTSIAEEFNAPLCAELMGGQIDAPAAQAVIDHLLQANLFVMPLDEHGQWFRYERLFRETLRYLLAQRSGKEGIAEAHRRARHWLARHGYIEAALQHALVEGDPEAAAALIEQQAHVLLDDENPAKLARWLELLPQALVSNRPGLLLARAAVLAFRGRFDLLPTLLTQTEALLGGDEGRDDLTRGQILTYQSLHWALAGDGMQTEECARKALSLLPSDRRWLSGSALGLRGLGLYMAGQIELADSVLTQEEAAGTGHWDTYFLRVSWGRCWIYLIAGDLARLLETAQRMLERSRAQCCPILRGWALFFLGFVRYHRNELDQADLHFSEGAGMVNAANGWAVGMCRVGMALISIARSQFGEARRWIESLAELDRAQGTATEEQRASLRARVALAQGDTESAIQWALSYQADLARSALLAFELSPLTRAHILTAEAEAGSLEVTMNELEILLRWAQECRNHWRTIQIRALQALVLDAQGRHEEALSTLEQALRQARPMGFLRIFADLGPPMVGLLRELAGRGVTPQYVERILAALGPTSTWSTLLTGREHDVLKLLARRFHNSEIASELVITTETVKKHTAHIYEKLGVNNRRQAVARARDLGILDHE